MSTTTSTLDNMLSTYYDSKLMDTIHSLQKYAQFAQDRPLPKGEGKTVVFNAWRPLTAVSGTLTEATAPGAESLSSRKVEATIAQYGKLVQVSDLVDLTAISSPVRGAIQELGYWAAQTLDRVCQAAIYKDQLVRRGPSAFASTLMSARASAWSSVTGTKDEAQLQFPCVFAGSAVSPLSSDGASASSKASVSAIIKAVRALESKDAPKFADGYYVGICHSQFKNDLLNDPRFESIVQYGRPGDMYKGEVGKVAGVRFVESNEVPYYESGTHSKTLDFTFIFGRNAYGLTKLDGGVKTYRIDKPDHTNPLAQYKRIGVKMNAVAKALNPSCGRILVTYRR